MAASIITDYTDKAENPSVDVLGITFHLDPHGGVTEHDESHSVLVRADVADEESRSAAHSILHALEEKVHGGSVDVGQACAFFTFHSRPLDECVGRLEDTLSDFAAHPLQMDRLLRERGMMPSSALKRAMGIDDTTPVVHVRPTQLAGQRIDEAEQGRGDR